jgi:hypothetical protein
MEANGLPSRTAILTAAARALGSRESDASVRNPDWVANRLIGPAELALIDAHPISRAFNLDIRQAMDDRDLLSAHLGGDFARISGVRGQPENAASGTPSSSRVWLWMPVSSGRKT